MSSGLSASGEGLSLPCPGQQHRGGPAQSLAERRAALPWALLLPEDGDADGTSLFLSLQTQLSEKPVQDRGLVVTDPRAEDVVLEHRSYCLAKARERNFAGDVLGYVTPVSWALVWTGLSQGRGGGWGPLSPPQATAAVGQWESHGSSGGCAPGWASAPGPEAAPELSVLCQWNSHGYDIAKIFGGKFTQISPVWLQLKRRGREMFEVTGLHDVDQGSHRAARLRIPGPSGGVRASGCVS